MSVAQLSLYLTVLRTPQQGARRRGGGSSGRGQKRYKADSQAIPGEKDGRDEGSAPPNSAGGDSVVVCSTRMVDIFSARTSPVSRVTIIML